MGEYDASIRRYQEVLESPLSKSLTVHSQVAIMLTTVLPRILPASQEAIDRERERFRDSVASVLHHRTISSPSPRGD
jgi:predicted nucleic acid-binding protein